MAARLQLTKRQALTLGARAGATGGSSGPPVSSRPGTGDPKPSPVAPKAKKPAKIPVPIFGSGLPETLKPKGCLLRIKLPIRLTNNNHGRGGSYHSSAEFRKECELQLIAWGQKWGYPWLGGIKGMPCRFADPVTINVVRILGPRERLWDSSSGLRGNWKEIEDSLVAIGWFQDDSPRWITKTTFDQVGTDRSDGPSIVVEIRKS